MMIRPLAASLLAISVLPAVAADAVRGKALYLSTNGAPLSCGTVGCHGPDPSQNINKVRLGSNPQTLLRAIDSVGSMTFLKPYVSAVDAEDIAAYIANPAAGTPAPAARLSTATLAFGNQVVKTASATMSATLTNSGTASLALTSITTAGANAADFVRSGTCAAPMTLAPSQSCSLQFVFTPDAVGSRSATVTISHNASPSTTQLGLSGAGVAAPQPAVGLSSTSVAFGDQVVGTSSAPRTVSISNTGAASLVLGTIATTGAQPADFNASNCSGTTLAPGASCTVSITFVPSALSARSATLAITSNASGSPHAVALSGTGTAAPAPAVALSPVTLSFGNQPVGQASAARSVTLANSGTAALAISAITVSGSGFSASPNCPATLPAGGTCTIGVTFTPTTAAAASGALAVATNAAGSPHAVALAGTGVAPTPTAPAVALSPSTVEFGSSPLNMQSGERTATLGNTGNAPLALAALTITGPAAGDFAQTNNCPVGGMLPSAANCTIRLRFTPSAEGARTASLAVTSNAAGGAAVELKGAGLVVGAAQARVDPAHAKFKRVKVGNSIERRIRVRNTGSNPLIVGAIAATGDYTQVNDCATPLAPSASCEIKVRFAPKDVGARNGELTVASNAAGAPHQVRLSGIGVASRVDEDCDEEAGCEQTAPPFGRKK